MDESSDNDCDSLDLEIDQLCKGFPPIDFSRWSLKLQFNSFINDLQNGFTLTNALNRLQTAKAMMEGLVINKKFKDDTPLETLPPGVIPAVEPKNIPRFNDLVIPQGKNDWLESNNDIKNLIIWGEELFLNENALRERILKIRSLDISTEKKSWMIQRLMMGKYGLKDNIDKENSIEDDNYIYQPPTDEDKNPSYNTYDILGCSHYQRNCKLQCTQCYRWIVCRFCHDEIDGINHQFERQKTNWIMCMKCFHTQKPAKSCESCNEEFALYFCDKCILYDNEETKDIYHCDKCGICRLGLGLGQDFFHCDGCQACLSIELQNNHKCIEKSTKSNCPICEEYMFTSVKPVVYMTPCGHAIHQHCFDEYTRYSYKCPNCQVTVLNMDAQFRVLDIDVQESVLPEPYCNWVCLISCNDCGSKNTCKYHILGLRCANCASYNTNQLKLIKPEDTITTPHNNDSDIVNITSTNTANLNTMRQELLGNHFQFEEISPLININNHEMFKILNIDDYMNDYSTQERSSHPISRLTSFTEKVKQFINDRSLDSTFAETFGKFLENNLQGLSPTNKNHDSEISVEDSTTTHPLA